MVKKGKNGLAKICEKIALKMRVRVSVKFGKIYLKNSRKNSQIICKNSRKFITDIGLYNSFVKIIFNILANISDKSIFFSS